MFPSGLWRGYWEQQGYGRQVMDELQLRFENGAIAGEGDDCIGPFTFAGQYDEHGAVVLVKQYVGAHQVLYRGEHDGEGTIFGRWSIGPYASGAFALTPVIRRVSPDSPILEI
jgi:hypothetical protein